MVLVGPYALVRGGGGGGILLKQLRIIFEYWGRSFLIQTLEKESVISSRLASENYLGYRHAF